MLHKDKYLVFEFDNVGETGLHWAAKRNKKDVIKLLLDNCAKVNYRDMGGRTALFLAAKHNFL
jgi:ankyrin repeat protein